MSGLYDVIGSGMTANKEWIKAISNNIANINTTRTSNGDPYHRQVVIFEEKNSFNKMLEKKMDVEGPGEGVRVKKVLQDKNENIVYSPEHPDADEQGYLRLPAINLAAEMTNLMMAQRGYESNVTSFNATKKINEKTYQIGRV